MGDEDEDKDEDKDEDEKMRHTVSESYSPPALALPALEVMDSEIRRAVVTIRAVKAHRLGDR